MLDYGENRATQEEMTRRRVGEKKATGIRASSWVEDSVRAFVRYGD